MSNDLSKQRNDDEYNGWPNYETWCVHLWLSNDQPTEEAARRVASLPDSADPATEMRSWIEENNPLADKASFYLDLLNHAISRVDWWRIVEAFREE